MAPESRCNTKVLSTTSKQALKMTLIYSVKAVKAFTSAIKPSVRWDSSRDLFWSPIVGGHLTFPKGHLTIPKRSQRIVSFISFCHLQDNDASSALNVACHRIKHGRHTEDTILEKRDYPKNPQHLYPSCTVWPHVFNLLAITENIYTYIIYIYINVCIKNIKTIRAFIYTYIYIYLYNII